MRLAIEAAQALEPLRGAIEVRSASREEGRRVLAEEKFDHVVFTGSTEVGRAIAEVCAQRLIASGVQWRSDLDSAWRKVAKNGDEIPEGAELVVPDTTEAKYISRGGLKLEGALRSTGLKVAGLRCLDVGQSTGGFTDCLLQQGAAQVVGVDVGHGQLHPSLRADARVVCIEGVNARSLTAEDLQAHHRRALMVALDAAEAAGTLQDQPELLAALDADFEPVFDFLTGDLSFISLTLVLPAVVRMLKPGGDLLMLVKPLASFFAISAAFGMAYNVLVPYQFEAVTEIDPSSSTAMPTFIIPYDMRI
jgi:predicted rRNA methylase YqxC with S4 and FtsJ domains